MHLIENTVKANTTQFAQIFLEVNLFTSCIIYVVVCSLNKSPKSIDTQLAQNGFAFRTYCTLPYGRLDRSRLHTLKLNMRVK